MIKFINKTNRTNRINILYLHTYRNLFRSYTYFWWFIFTIDCPTCHYRNNANCSTLSSFNNYFCSESSFQNDYFFNKINCCTYIWLNHHSLFLLIFWMFQRKEKSEKKNYFTEMANAEKLYVSNNFRKVLYYKTFFIFIQTFQIQIIYNISIIYSFSFQCK